VSQRTRPARLSRRPSLADEFPGRVPPGQLPTRRWPILHQGEAPAIDLTSWDLRVWGLVDAPLIWAWETVEHLPRVMVSGDLHCVTRWSSMDHEWSGISPRAIWREALVRPDARYVLLHGEGGYTANLPIEAFLAEDSILATHHDGEPLDPAHGAPLRAIIPGRYAWKSVKWLRGIEFLDRDRQGFWEGYGYNSSADPWLEERFETP
jgi:DMSO/TMAO reductase YedYZ molybdopterin-dependent catalytic subunit